MKTSLQSAIRRGGAALVAAAAICSLPSALAANHQTVALTDDEPISLKLDGKTLEAESWRQDKWNGQSLSVANGTLAFTKSVSVHGGEINIAGDATLRFARTCSLGTGLGDARTRVFNIAPGGRLDMDGIDWRMDHTKVVLPKGAFWNADLTRFSLEGAQKDNLWDVAGRAVFARGIKVSRGDWGAALKLVLRKGASLALGGPVSTEGTKKCSLEIVLEGGKVDVFWNASLQPGIVRLAPGAQVELNIAKGLDFDVSAIEVPANAKLRVKRNAAPPGDLPPRFPLEVRYDRTGRSYWISAEPFKDEIKSIRFKHPNPDASSNVKYEIARPAGCVFRMRFPEGKGPWEVTAGIVAKDGTRSVESVTVARPEKTVQAPAAENLVLVGLTGYGDAHDLTRGILEEDLCNLYVGWHSAAKLLPENVPPDIGARWADAIDKRKLWAMSIYAGDDAKLQARLREVYGSRYLGNNAGEYASFMYQGREQCPIRMNLDLAAAKEEFVNKFMAKASFGWMANFPWMFSTCGASLSCYELAGGVDFICNELWAIGAQNIAHTTAEARGAARKWGPEYWCAWNAHEWQTTGIPYRTRQKYDSCLAGFLLEYISGTSMIVLESGSQGKQAWQYTADEPGQPKEERAKEGYDGHVAKSYRATVKKFYDWVKANPRPKGSPETKIAMALGNLDGYIGQMGGFTVWSQHDNAAADPKRWKYGPPEATQALIEDIFFPRPASLTAPFRNSWLGGTPYGQVDVMQIDDESTLADLERYELIVFGGWNTMTPHIRDVLERYVQNGGTLVMSRAELTTRTDRDFIDCGDADLMPLFSFLPPEGKPGAFAERKSGKGRFVLFTAREWPAASQEGRQAYERMVRNLAGNVRQAIRIEEADGGRADAIACAVYGDTVYLLNTDTVQPHTITCTRKNHREKITLAPCEVRILKQHSKAAAK